MTIAYYMGLVHNVKLEASLAVHTHILCWPASDVLMPAFMYIHVR